MSGCDPTMFSKMEPGRILPFWITTETLDFGLGASYNVGMFQSQSNIFVTGYVTFNAS